MPWDDEPDVYSENLELDMECHNNDCDSPYCPEHNRTPLWPLPECWNMDWRAYWPVAMDDREHMEALLASA